MNTNHRKQDAPPPKRDHLEDLVDEADEESFPASDPPAVTPRREPVRPAPEDPPPASDRKRPARD